jgi:membrane-associated protease RseP (regulator of RpoE activity)
VSEETPEAPPGGEPAPDAADTVAVPVADTPAAAPPEPPVEAADPAPAPAPAEAPTVAAPVAATPVAAPAPAASAPAANNGFFIPRWVGYVALAIVGILIVGGIGYAIGHDNASGGGSNAGANFPGNGNFPGGGTNGNGNFPGGNTNGSGNGNGGTNGGGQTFPGGGTLPGNGGTTQSGGFLGVAIQDPTSGSGAEVTAVASGSPAASADLAEGDVITKVDSTDIADAAALQQAIRAHASGDTVTITYTRDGTTSTAKVTLGNAATRTQPS